MIILQSLYIYLSWFIYLSSSLYISIFQSLYIYLPVIIWLSSSLYLSVLIYLSYNFLLLSLPIYFHVFFNLSSYLYYIYKFIYAIIGVNSQTKHDFFLSVPVLSPLSLDQACMFVWSLFCLCFHFHLGQSLHIHPEWYDCPIHLKLTNQYSIQHLKNCNKRIIFKGFKFLF